MTGVDLTRWAPNIHTPDDPAIDKPGSYLFYREGVENCKTGNCLSFNGVDGKAVVTSAPALNPGLSDFSVSVRFMPEGDQQMQVLSKGGSTHAYRIYWEGDNVSAGYYTGSTWHMAWGPANSCPLHQWCHVVMSWDRDGLFRIYVNGVEGGSFDASADQYTNFQPSLDLELGSDSGLPGAWFEGVIDELEFYDSVVIPRPMGSAAVPYVSWSYDDPAMSNSVGRLTRVTDAAGSETNQYDEMGRVWQINRTLGSQTYTVGQQWNALNRLASKEFPDSDTFTYTYNRAGWLESISGTVDNVVYNARGQIATIEFPNGKDSVREYDNQTYRLETMKVNGVQDLEYAYDDKGNITNIIDYLYTTGSRVFTYDHLDRLKTASGKFGGTNQADVSETYEYDPVGNLVEKAGVTYHYDGPNNRVHRTDGGGVPAKDYVYDANGNMTENGSDQYEWDQDNRLISVNGSVSFVYDYTGRRLQKDSIQYPFADYEVESGGSQKFFTVNGELVAAKTGSSASGRRFYHTDHLGGVHLVTNTSGNVVQALEYDPWGRVSLEWSPGATTRKFTGQEFDEETDLYYYVGRYYDPVLGRFTRPDPFVQDPFNPQNLNRYSYVLNNPTSLTDPSGFMPDEIYDDGGFDVPLHSDQINVPSSIDGGYGDFIVSPCGIIGCGGGLSSNIPASGGPVDMFFRVYVPFSETAGGFGGDGPGLSFETEDRRATARMFGHVRFDRITGHVSEASIVSDPTTCGRVTCQTAIAFMNLQPFLSGVAAPQFRGTAEPNIDHSVQNGILTIRLSGSNPLLLSPDINVNLAVTLGQTLSGRLFGDAFPNTQVFIIDRTGPRPLINFRTQGHQEFGPFLLLPGDNNRPMGRFR